MKSLLLFLFLCCGIFLFAQDITPFTVVTAGQTDAAASAPSMDWTLGEIILEPLDTAVGTAFITSGFLQPRVTITAVREDVSDDIQVSLFPNPTAGQLHLRFDLPEARKLTLALHASDGRLIWREDLYIQTGSLQRDVRQLPAGAYVLTIAQGHHKTRSFNLIKVH